MRKIVQKRVVDMLERQARQSRPEEELQWGWRYTFFDGANETDGKKFGFSVGISYIWRKIDTPRKTRHAKDEGKQGAIEERK